MDKNLLVLLKGFEVVFVLLGWLFVVNLFLSDFISDKIVITSEEQRKILSFCLFAFPYFAYFIVRFKEIHNFLFRRDER